jgi:putative ABC transport system substrate-binding protein
MRLRPILLFFLGSTLLITAFASAEAQQGGKVATYRLSHYGAYAASYIHRNLPSGPKGSWLGGGQNIIFLFKGAAGDDQLPRLAEELVPFKVDLIVATNASAAAAVLNATKTIPIVQVSGQDPVALGWAKSLARPGRNLTGINAAISPEISAKRFQLIREVIPGLSRLAILRTPDDLGVLQAWRTVEDAARMVNVQLRWFEFRPGGDLEGMIALVKQEGHDALYVSADAILFQHRRLIVELAARHRIPATYGIKEYVVDEGGLMSYGVDLAAYFERRPVMSTEFSRDRIQPICPSNSPPSLSWSSTSRPPRPSV